MAEAVASALAAGRHLVVRAGTGTGKSLAYLVPAVLSGRRVVVATATKALQDQLAGKDLPFLARHLDVPFEAAVLKGRSNYACRQRLHEHAGGVDTQLSLTEELLPSARAEVERLARWAESSETGDQAELDWAPSPGGVAGRQRHRRGVPGRVPLPVRRPVLRRGRPGPGGRRPTSSWSTPTSTACTWPAAACSSPSTTSSCSTRPTSSRTSSPTRPASPSAPAASRALARIIGRVVADDGLTARLGGRRRRRWPAALQPHHGRRLPLDARRHRRRRRGRPGPGRRGAGRPARRSRPRWSTSTSASSGPRRRPGSLAVDLDAALALPDTSVAWVGGPPGDPRLEVAPIDVGPVLATHVWDRCTAVLTSATIPAPLPDPGRAAGRRLRRARRRQPVRLRGPRHPLLRRPPARPPAPRVRAGQPRGAGGAHRRRRRPHAGPVHELAGHERRRRGPAAAPALPPPQPGRPARSRRC